MKWSMVILFLSQYGFAIDAVNPNTICDRFYLESEIHRCEAKVKNAHPDSYLAAVCQSFFDDDSFYDCLEMGAIASFNPLKLDECSSIEGNDNAKLDCLRRIASFDSKKADFQTTRRLPASVKPKAAR
jgi:hypothetical protein